MGLEDKLPIQGFMAMLPECYCWCFQHLSILLTGAEFTIMCLI